MVVVGAAADDPPPGIEAAGGLVDLRFAPDDDTLRALAPDAEAVFSWQTDREALRTAWSGLGRLRWLHM